MYVTLTQSDTVQPYGHSKEVTRSVGVELRKKSKDLSVHEKDESGHGKGVRVYDESLFVYYNGESES